MIILQFFQNFKHTRSVCDLERALSVEEGLPPCDDTTTLAAAEGGAVSAVNGEKANGEVEGGSEVAAWEETGAGEQKISEEPAEGTMCICL